MEKICRWCLGYRAAIGGMAVAALLSHPAAAQFGGDRTFELSAAVQIEDIDETDARPQLARIHAYVADKKWDEAIEAIRKVAESYGERIVPVDDRRYLSVRQFCNLQLAAMPPEALAIYRARVDPVASGWYKQGLAQRDELLLTNVVEQFYCSSYGDDSLLALGDIYLERGEFGRARAAWQQISPLLRGPDGRQAWQWLQGVDLNQRLADIAKIFSHRDRPPVWLAYPDTDLDLAAVQARLVLASILEGSLPRARRELALFERLHPHSAGHLAGRDGPYHQTLAALLDEAPRWPAAKRDDDWSTFAGDATRNRVLPERLNLGGLPTWEMPLPVLSTNDNDAEPSQRRSEPLDIDSEANGGLPFHPLLVRGNVLLCNEQQILAFNAQTGKPAQANPGGVAGRIFPGGDETPAHGTPTFLADTVGRPRYTLSAYGDLLFARIGSPVTGRPTGANAELEMNYLVCLNLGTGGSLLWRFPAYRERAEINENDERWAVEGPPVCDGTYAYVGLRRSGFRPEAYVAALDIHNKGRLVWRRRICSADTPGHGMLNEVTQNLLTLHEGVLYYNTNLGAIAALSTRNGAINWVYRYERAHDGDLRMPPAPTHFRRYISPCVYADGLVMTAPSDSPTIVAIDATTGLLAWQTPKTHPLDWDTPKTRSANDDDPEDDHPTHLLGVCGGNLIASGKSVFWIDVARGYVVRQWPETSRDGERGYGRGLLAGGCIYWPTREQIIVLDQRLYGEQGVRIVDRIQLTRPDNGERVTGGNLVAAGGTLLVAGQRRLFAFVTRQPARPAAATAALPRSAEPAAAAPSP